MSIIESDCDNGNPTKPPASPTLPQAEPVAADADDPINLATLRLGQDFASAVGLRRVITTVPVRKPNRAEFVRVQRGDQWQLPTAVLEDRVTRDVYLVRQELWQDLAGEITRVCLFTAINRQGSLFLWPVKMPGPDGRVNPWHHSAICAAQTAQEQWVRVYSNMEAGMYEVVAATGVLTEPSWPDITFESIVRLAFRDRWIDSHAHPVLRSLRGEC